jgi:hypothetical protein
MLQEDLAEQTRLFAEARILQLEAAQGGGRGRTGKSEEAKTSLDRLPRRPQTGYVGFTQQAAVLNVALGAYALSAARSRSKSA